jgi:tudor domain-containing protein 2
MFFSSSVGNDQYRICVIQGNREGAQLAESLIHDIILNQPLIESYEMVVPQVRKSKAIPVTGYGGL